MSELANGDFGLSWSQLRAFEACARLSSFKVAALALSLTASAVRFQVGLLEARIGTPLFERQGGRLALTKTGATFARQIARPMQQLLTACATARHSASDAPLTLTAPPLFARQFLLGDAFLKWCDANNVRIEVSDAKRDLLAPGQIAAVRLHPDADPEMVLLPLLKVELCIAAAPVLAESARPKDPDWWMAQTLLCPSASVEAWSAAWRGLQMPQAFSPRRLAYSSYSAATEAACAGHGLILAPLPFAQKEISAGQLMILSDLRIQAEKGYELAMRRDVSASRRGQLLTRQLVRLCRR